MSLVILGLVRPRLLSKSLVSDTITSAPRRYASKIKHPKRIPTTINSNTSSQKPLQHASQKSAVNPPVSTLPPPLDLAEQRPDQSKVAYYFGIGKSFVGFYKTALKAVWTNYRESRVITSRISSKDSQGYSTKYLESLQKGLLSRAEFQLVTRSREDIKKLPLIGLLVLVCGEFTPLLVRFVSGIIPKTAWIPKQVYQARINTQLRRDESFREGTVKKQAELKRISASKGIRELDPAQILHISRALGLHSTWWEKLWDRPPQWIAKNKVHRALEYLEVDDHAIQRDGGLQALSDAETERACEQRGLDVLGHSVSTLRYQLKQYMNFRVTSEVSVAAMILLRPSSWDKFL